MQQTSCDALLNYLSKYFAVSKESKRPEFPKAWLWPCMHRSFIGGTRPVHYQGAAMRPLRLYHQRQTTNKKAFVKLYVLLNDYKKPVNEIRELEFGCGRAYSIAQ